MLRVLCAGAIGMTLLMGQSLLAQGPSPKDSVKKLQAELDALKLRIKDVEALLEKAKSESDKKPGFGKGKGKGRGPGGFGPPGKGKGPGEFGKGPWSKPGEFGKPGFGPRGFGKGPGPRPGEYGMGLWKKPGEYGRGPWGDSWGRKGFRPPDRTGDPRTASVSNAEILRTLNHILREIEDLRRQLRR
jgi:hypothetical protein